MRFVAMILAGAFLPGCARYEYDLIQPPALARHIGETPQNVPADPLVYHMRTVENRLVMLIQNPTPDPVQILGDRSVIVDPGGESHPLPSQTIAPGTYVKLILPPFRPAVYNPGPSFIIGVGGVYGRGFRGRHGFGDDFFYYDEPRYLSYYDPGDPFFFTWQSETDIRMTFSYLRGDRGFFQHSFTFHRKKVS